MRNTNRILLVTVFALGVIGFFSFSFAGGGNPSLVVVTPEIDLAKDTKVKFKGTGFTPGEKVSVLFTDVNGIPTDIEYALKPKPKADANGDWETTWNAKRFMQRKLIKAGEYNVSADDADYNVLDSKTIKFVGKFPKKKKKK